MLFSFFVQGTRPFPLEGRLCVTFRSSRHRHGECRRENMVRFRFFEEGRDDLQKDRGGDCLLLFAVLLDIRRYLDDGDGPPESGVDLS